MERFVFVLILVLFLTGSQAAVGQTNWSVNPDHPTKHFNKAEKKHTRMLARAARKDERYQQMLAKANEKYERDQENLRQRYNRRQHKVANQAIKTGASAAEVEITLQKLKLNYDADQLALRQRYERDRDKRQAAWERQRKKLSNVKHP